MSRGHEDQVRDRSPVAGQPDGQSTRDAAELYASIVLEEYRFLRNENAGVLNHLHSLALTGAVGLNAQIGIAAVGLIVRSGAVSRQVIIMLLSVSVGMTAAILAVVCGALVERYLKNSRYVRLVLEPKMSVVWSVVAGRPGATTRGTLTELASPLEWESHFRYTKPLIRASGAFYIALILELALPPIAFLLYPLWEDWLRAPGLAREYAYAMYIANGTALVFGLGLAAWIWIRWAASDDPGLPVAASAADKEIADAV